MYAKLCVRFTVTVGVCFALVGPSEAFFWSMLTDLFTPLSLDNPFVDVSTSESRGKPISSRTLPSSGDEMSAAHPANLHISANLGPGPTEGGPTVRMTKQTNVAGGQMEPNSESRIKKNAVESGALPQSPANQQNGFFHPQRGYQPRHPNQPPSADDICSCNCDGAQKSDAATEPECEWKMIFKAVGGNGRSVYDDFMGDSYINGHVPEARKIMSDLPYKHPHILAQWNSLFLDQIKVEVFNNGLRKAWFVFNGIGTDKTTWMTRNRLIASTYDNIKTEDFQDFTIFNSGNDRVFLIMTESTSCDNTCGYLEVIDPYHCEICCWQDIYEQPYFMYGIAPDQCGSWMEEGDFGIGDRLVISAKVCPIGW